MMLLPEYRENAANERDSAPAAGAAARGQAAVAAQLPIRTVAHPLPHLDHAPAQSRATSAQQSRRPAPAAGTREGSVKARPAGQAPLRATRREPSAHPAEPLPAPATPSVRAVPGVPASARRESASIREHSAQALALVGQPVAQPARAVAPAHAGATAAPLTAPARRWKFSRLPRRGQRLLVGAGFAVAIGLGAVIGGIVEPGIDVPAETTVVTVQPGESLWQIAGAAADPGTDLRPMMERIRELNELTGSTVTGGERLLVPAAGE